MRFDIVSLFPDRVVDMAMAGVTGRAVERGLVDLHLWDPRAFAQDRHRTVDDRPYGGGPGMVMKFEPLRDAIRAARADAEIPARTLYLSPQGQLLNQQQVVEFSECPRLILVAGRYEGIDERLIERQRLMRNGRLATMS
jgi:tRNA (guanine37-N1)-methyltransferase